MKRKNIESSNEETKGIADKSTKYTESFDMVLSAEVNAIYID